MICTTIFTDIASQPNELVQQQTSGFGVATYTRDGQGNMTSETTTDPITSALYVNKTFHYDSLERPISSTNVQNGATITATLGYNALSERITYTAVMSGQVVDGEQFAYQADGSLARTIATTATLNANGTVKSSGAYTDTYAYDPQGAPLYLLRQQGGTTSAYTYLSDGHGNVTGLSDSSGHRVNMDDYNPYGAPVGVGINESVPQNFRIWGLWGDNELGQNYLGDPRYEDVSGMCDQPDTSSGARENACLTDNPIDASNPSGFCTILIHYEPAVASDAGPNGGILFGKHPFLTLTDNGKDYWRYEGTKHRDGDIESGPPKLEPPDSRPEKIPQPIPVEYRQPVTTLQPYITIASSKDKEPCRCAFKKLEQVGRQINARHLPYSFTYLNSEAFAYTILKHSGLHVPSSQELGQALGPALGAQAPGWGVDLLKPYCGPLLLPPADLTSLPCIYVSGRTRQS